MDDNLITLCINGYVNLEITNLDDSPIGDDLRDDILKKLQEGSYIIGLSTRLIFHIDNLNKSIFKFEIITTDALDYEFSVD